jgi:leader peptidase (prepilin peptidase) / N-methyltransferase
MTAVLARAAMPWEGAVLAWLVPTGVPLACIEAAARRQLDSLTAAAFAGTAGLLAAAALAGHGISALGRASAGAAALACAYPAVTLGWPGGTSLGGPLTELVRHCVRAARLSCTGGGP